MLKRLFIIIATILTILAMTMVAKSQEDDSHPETFESELGYVGSETCARCHANTHTTFIQTWHPKMLRSVEEAGVLGDFESPASALSFGREDVKWVIGGQYKQRYLTELDGELFVLPAEWNVLTGEWVAYEAENWRARPYKRYCAGCHTTGYDVVTETWVEAGIGCEACHGPGADHVASTGNRTQIINPARLAFQDQVEVCAQCHSRGMDPSGQFPYAVGYYPGGPAELSETFILTTDPNDFWPDSTAKRHHMQYQDWRQGEHRNSVSCIFCHTSHEIGETDHQTRMVGNDRCVICHEGNADLAEHIPFMASATDNINCTDCHMPQISKLIPTDFQILSHTFHAPDPALSIAYGGQDHMPNSCNLCHEDKTPEWAAAVLGKEIPPGEATRVPPPTPPPIPTTVSIPESDTGTSRTVSIPQTSLLQSNPWLWGLGAIVLVGIAGLIWAYRRMRPT